ncbi:MAG: CBS domain-containing protein, partial [Chloroflexia bacterium]
RKTILFVTHDIEEAIRLADKIAVMRQGKLVQYDTPLHILSNPADPFVADLVGSEDVLRRLSLLSVQSVMSPVHGPASDPSASTLPPTATLREALNILLSADTHALTIVDNENNPIGTLDLEAIKRATDEGRRTKDEGRK